MESGSRSLPCNCKNPETGNQGEYWMEKPCCVGRLIANTPSVKRQDSLKAYYQQKKGSEYMKQVEASIEKWSQK